MWSSRVRPSRSASADAAPVDAGQPSNVISTPCESFTIRSAEGIASRFGEDDVKIAAVCEKEEVCIGFRLNALRIDLPSSSYTMKCRIFYEWCDEKLAAKLENGEVDDSWEKHVPEITFLNAIDVTEDAWPRAPRLVKSGRAGRMYTHRKYSVTGADTPELLHFPFDMQTIPVMMQLAKKHFRGTHCLRLLPLELRNVPKVPGYLMLTPDVGGQHSSPIEDQRQLDAFKAKPVLHIPLRVRRESGFFVRNILVYMTLLSSLGFISFFLDDDGGVANLNNRVALLVSIVFTIIALRFSTTDSVPQVSTSTWLDFYQNGCMIMLVAMAVVHTLIHGVVAQAMNGSSLSLLFTLGQPINDIQRDDEMSMENALILEVADLIASLFFLSLWITFNVWYWCRTSYLAHHFPEAIETHAWRATARAELINWTQPWGAGDDRPPMRVRVPGADARSAADDDDDDDDHHSALHRRLATCRGASIVNHWRQSNTSKLQVRDISPSPSSPASLVSAGGAAGAAPCRSPT